MINNSNEEEKQNPQQSKVRFKTLKDAQTKQINISILKIPRIKTFFQEEINFMKRFAAINMMIQSQIKKDKNVQ